jgi:membrane associated rhomboid family serine protease
MVLLMWFVFWVEVRFGFNFTNYGIFPQKVSGLIGIILAPLIHSDLQHLYHNSLPTLILGAALFYFYRPIAWKVLVFGVLSTGFFTWLIGRPAYHIGMSGVIYLLFGFLFFKGVFTKHFRLIALSLAVVFVYGSMVMYALPIKSEISWEGHLSGLVVGFLLSIVLKSKISQTPKYHWEQPDYNSEDDPFMKHFDEDGNFIEHLETNNHELPTSITYHYKEDKS